MRARARATGVFAAAALAFVMGCAPSYPEGYRLAFAAGQRAFTSGRYLEAAAAFDKAAGEADRVKDRDEARFYQALAYKQGGKLEDSREALRRLVAESPDGPRTVRAEYDLARMEIAEGDAERGYAELEEVLRRRPNHGLAERALRDLVQREEDLRGTGAAVTWLRAATATFRGTELEEIAGYLLGRAMEKDGDLEGAHAALIATAEAHPYPYGGFTDDAYWFASEIAKKLQKYPLAADDLRRMLAPLEVSTLNGSYERPRFALAQMALAEILRDYVGDRAGARRELHKVFTLHPHSRFVDDALWEEARLASLDGDTEAACDALEDLKGALPQSRFVPCAGALCPEMAQGEACAAYVLDDLAAGPAKPGIERGGF